MIDFCCLGRRCRVLEFVFFVGLFKEFVGVG